MLVNRWIFILFFLHRQSHLFAPHYPKPGYRSKKKVSFFAFRRTATPVNRQNHL